jgi:diguanylate cyclase (GGDEF)-like protein
VALSAGRGAGLTGLFDKGMHAFGTAAAAVALAQMLHEQTWSPVGADTFTALQRGFIVFAIFQSCAILLAASLALGGKRRSWRSWRALLRCSLLEALNVPAGWLLAGLLARSSWVQAAVMGGLVLGGEYVLLRLSDTLGALRASKRSLTSRMSELETLHSIGREVLSSMDPARLFPVIERECRKILEVDFFFIAIMAPDGSRLEAVYRHQHRSAAESEPMTLEQGLARRVAEKQQALRVDDFLSCPDDSPLRHGLVGEESRSAMAVPLLVNERAIGVLSVQSVRPRAYDDHQLAILTTIAQQAAVAIENARQYQRASVDSLTGFLLRDPFFKRLDEEQRRAARYGARFSLLMIDLDRFKEINDRSGHLGGDRYLQSVGGAIREQLRGADLACRYGGDEFCLMLPETDLAGAKTIAERIRIAVARHIVGVEGDALRTTVSVGIASFPEHGGGDAAKLLRLADEALYRAKRSGRDCVVASAL